LRREKRDRREFAEAILDGRLSDLRPIAPTMPIYGYLWARQFVSMSSSRPAFLESSPQVMLLPLGQTRRSLQLRGALRALLLTARPFLGCDSLRYAGSSASEGRAGGRGRRTLRGPPCRCVCGRRLYRRRRRCEAAFSTADLASCRATGHASAVACCQSASVSRAEHIFDPTDAHQILRRSQRRPNPSSPRERPRSRSSATPLSPRLLWSALSWPAPSRSWTSWQPPSSPSEPSWQQPS